MSALLAIQGQAQEATDTQHLVEEVSGGVDLGEMILHHLVDSNEWEFFTSSQVLHLPTFPPVHIGPLTLDLSISKHVVLMMMAVALVSVVMISAARAMQRRGPDRAPSGFSHLIEVFITFFRNDVVRPNISHGADTFVPYILSLFFFILTCNLFGLVPLMGTATGNLSVTAALAVLSFILVEVSGFRTLGAAGYARTIFYAPPGLSGPMKYLLLAIMTPVEFIGKLTKPFALAIRLFANMTAGHTLILALIGIIFVFGDLVLGRWFVAGGSMGLGIAIMCLELFVAFLQAYIFAMLTSVFIGLIQHAH